MPEPMNSDGTSPVRPRTGVLAPYADATAAEAFRKPTPGTTANTPGRPPAFA